MSKDFLPAFSKHNIPIVLASSAYYAPYMAVTIQSIIDTAGDSYNYDIIIFGNQIADEDRQLIISQSLGKSNISICFVNVDNEIEHIGYNFREGYAVESFYRVLLMKLLPQYDKVIYLDSDVIVKKDLAILFQHDLQGYLVAAARDPDGIKCYYQNFKNRALYMDEVLGLDAPECYFQSGVMLFNLEQWRKTKTIEDVLDIACSPKLIWGDQDALNVICRNRVLYFDMRWNTVVDGYRGRVKDVKEWASPSVVNEYLEARQNPYIIHYAGVQPWKNETVDMAEHFWPVAKRTPFYPEILKRVEENRPLLGKPGPLVVPGAPFAISVIVPVYNAEEYLSETIESVLTQTLDFEKYIQLILVNNATQDNSEELCLKYQYQYPNNILYVKLEKNRGPNGARMEGLKYATGKYINFLDSDDKWGHTAFDTLLRYFEAHYFETDIVAARIRRFDAIDEWDLRDEKFTQTRIVDVAKDYMFLLQNLCSCWIKATVFQTVSMAIAEEHIHAEDGMFLTEVIAKRQAYAVVKEAIFYYRKEGIREKSLLLGRFSDKRWYNHTVKNNYLVLIEREKGRTGKLSLHAQNWLAVELCDRVSAKQPDCLTEEEFQQYRSMLGEVASQVEDHIILENRNKGVNELKKYAFLYLKYGDAMSEHIKIRQGKFYFDNLDMYGIADQYRVSFDVMEIRKGSLHIKGHSRFFEHGGQVQLILKSDSGHTFAIKQSDFIPEKQKAYCLGKEIPYYKFLEAEIPLQYVKDLSLFAIYDGHRYKISFGLGDFSAVTGALANDYYWKDGYVLTVQNEKIKIEPCGKKGAVIREKKLFMELWKKGRRKVALLRMATLAARILKKKELWLITDRITSAKDSGEAFFRYLSVVKSQNIKPIFVISKCTDDYKRLQQYGTVVNYGSWWHKFFFVLADKTVSSLTNTWVYNLMPYNREFIRSIRHAEFIHIQHGVIKDDISDSINCLEKNIKMITTAGQAEYQSILDRPYGYGKNNVALTGLARHDWLDAERKKKCKLLIAPTWRLAIRGPYSVKEDRFTYNNQFKKTDFYKFYNRLINDDDLLRCMKKHGMSGEMKLHPMQFDQKDDFVSNDCITVINATSQSYEEEIESYCLLVTDYSSIAFDYAYVNTPVIYTQFDKEAFSEFHSYRLGYFDYERDGFGPVVYDYESTVQAIIAAIDKNCVMEEKYKKRIDEFFAYHDGKNCERIYQEILNMDKESGE